MSEVLLKAEFRVFPDAMGDVYQRAGSGIYFAENICLGVFHGGGGLGHIFDFSLKQSLA